MDGVELICCYPFFLSFFLFSAQVCVIRSHPSSEERRRFFGIFLTGKGGKNILLSFFSFKLAVLNESLLCDTNNSGSRRRLNFCSFICIYVLFAATNVSTFLLFAVTFLLFKLSHDDFGIEENPPSCVETKCINININFTFEGEEEGFSSEGEEEKSFSSRISLLLLVSPQFLDN